MINWGGGEDVVAPWEKAFGTAGDLGLWVVHGSLRWPDETFTSMADTW